MIDLNEYKQCVEVIRRYADEYNVSQERTSEIFENCFRHLETTYAKKSSKGFQLLKVAITLSFVSVVCLICICNEPSFSSILVRNLQNSIYPGLKLLRKLAIPIITYYPVLSELYDEWCLIENPYFYIGEMDCWPCRGIYSIPDLTGHNISRRFNIGIPYTRMAKGTEVSMKSLSEMYWKNQDVFERHARKISSNNATYKTIQDVVSMRLDIQPSKFLDTHISWRLNRMEPGRIVRKLFSKPTETPNWWSQSIEKFVLIDEANSLPYLLPNSECSNVVIQCSQGARLIKMIPSLECLQNCKTSTILLSSGHTLWYNWWYWRPVSLPVLNTTAITINYLTSYC